MPGGEPKPVSEVAGIGEKATSQLEGHGFLHAHMLLVCAVVDFFLDFEPDFQHSRANISS